MTQNFGLRMALLALLVASVTGSHLQATSPALSANDLPDGVRYITTTPARLEQAATALRSALARGPEALAAMLGGHTNSERALAGPFLSIQVVGDDLHALKYLRNFTYTVTWDRKGTKFQAPGLFGETPEQKRLLAQYLFLVSNRSPEGQVRAATFEELSIIWGWISWDIDEPLLVYQAGDERLAFDFDPASGRITWIERLTEPCFSGAQGDQSVLTCHCVRIERKLRNWQMQLDPLPACRSSADAPLQATDVAQAEGNRTHTRVALQLSERTRRVDRSMAKLLANDYALLLVPEGAANFTSVGKLLAGRAPEAPVDEAGKPVHGYVLVAHVIDAAGVVAENRPMLYTDERLLAAVLAATKTWRLEPAKLDGAPVAEVAWQQFDF
ncbi:MAG TPA: hypothetical protein VGO61_17600 [Steroidobacteraceae bacterium]|jgi:hypothetical protein|nr:hypothetical protein [Steroidobacteraceae bacterium]